MTDTDPYTDPDDDCIPPEIPPVCMFDLDGFVTIYEERRTGRVFYRAGFYVDDYTIPAGEHPFKGRDAVYQVVRNLHVDDVPDLQNDIGADPMDLANIERTDG